MRCFNHIVPQQLVISILMKDYTLLVNVFYKNNDSVLPTFKKIWSLRDNKKDCGPMPAKSLKKMIEKF